MRCMLAALPFGSPLFVHGKIKSWVDGMLDFEPECSDLASVWDDGVERIGWVEEKVLRKTSCNLRC